MSCSALLFWDDDLESILYLFVVDSEVICYSQKREIKLPVSATHNPVNDDSNRGSATLNNYLQRTAAAITTTTIAATMIQLPCMYVVRL